MHLIRWKSKKISPGLNQANVKAVVDFFEVKLMQFDSFLLLYSFFAQAQPDFVPFKPNSILQYTTSIKQPRFENLSKVLPTAHTKFRVQIRIKHPNLSLAAHFQTAGNYDVDSMTT